MKTDFERRKFLKQSIAISAGAVLLPYASDAATGHDKDGEGCIFLFQGDSITDGNRSRNNDWNHVLGHGYDYLLASRLWYDFPNKKFQFYNRGISGNKVTDLITRWQPDALEIKPDVLSILIGINDLDAYLQGDGNYGKENFESAYRSLLQQTRNSLPSVQLVLCEPFILPVGKVKDKWDLYSAEITVRQEVVKKMATEFNAIFIACQKAFDNALQKAPADYWIWDGIHPMPAGHELISREWMKTVSKKMTFIK